MALKLTSLSPRVAMLQPSSGIRHINDLKAHGSHRLRGKGLQTQRARVFLRDKFACQACGAIKLPAELEMDHTVPLFEGGSSKDDNCRTMCIPCHKAKSAKEKTRANVAMRSG